jgi:murein DD-endopeptidase MepM/ murein hydrolase activator NlpD
MRKRAPMVFIALLAIVSILFAGAACPGSSTKVTGVSISLTSSQHAGQATIFEGQKVTLTANVSPSGASNKNVTWKEENTFGANNAVPTLSSTTASQITFTANAKGRAQRKVTVTTAEGGYTASAIIIVCEDVANYKAKIVAGGADFYKGPSASNYGSKLATIAAGTEVEISAKYGDDWLYLKNPSSNQWGYIRTAKATAQFIWPLQNSSGNPSNFTITSNYGFRIYGGNERTHKGTDISAAEGTTVVAIAAGTVSDYGYDSEMGHYVRVTHANGYVSHYQHLKTGTKLTGGTVSQKQKIAETGDSGSPGSYHLHINLYKGSVANANLINVLEGYNDDDIRGPLARKQRVPQPFYKKSGSAYIFNTSYNLSQRDAYWNGSDTAGNHKSKTSNLYSRFNPNPITNAYPNIHD